MSIFLAQLSGSLIKLNLFLFFTGAGGGLAVLVGFAARYGCE